MSKTGITNLHISTDETYGEAPAVTYITGCRLGPHAIQLDIHTHGGYAEALTSSNGETRVEFRIGNRPGYKTRGSGGDATITFDLPAVPLIGEEKALWSFVFETNRYGIRVICINEVGLGAEQEWLYDAPDQPSGATSPSGSAKAPSSCGTADLVKLLQELPPPDATFAADIQEAIHDMPPADVIAAAGPPHWTTLQAAEATGHAASVAALHARTGLVRGWNGESAPADAWCESLAVSGEPRTSDWRVAVQHLATAGQG